MTTAVRPRDPRLPVRISARMRTGSSWSDVQIMNVSHRGLMISGPQLPTRGAYVEVRKGRQIIVARVVWSDRARIGVHTQEKVPVQNLIDEIGRAVEQSQTDGALKERREIVRPKDRVSDLAARSRLQARALDFGIVLVLAITGAWLAFDAVTSVISAPMATIETALIGHSRS